MEVLELRDPLIPEPSHVLQLHAHPELPAAPRIHPGGTGSRTRGSEGEGGGGQGEQGSEVIRRRS